MTGRHGEWHNAVQAMTWSIRVLCTLYRVCEAVPQYCCVLRVPWHRDVGALSRNNGIVQHCCVSLATQQLKRRAYQQAAWLLTQQ
jgi:hypothetical protein